jgi:hypothetical protein
MQIHLLKPQKPFATLVVVGLLCESCAARGLLSEIFRGRHSRHLDYSAFALQHGNSRIATLK